MPIRLPENFPAKHNLTCEGIETLAFSRATHQDIRPLKIILLNLMPTKITTETQILRLLSCSSIQIEPLFLRMGTHNVKYGANHIEQFYFDFADIENEYFDGLIITGAPVEKLDFQNVDYWDELVRITKWAKSHVFATLFICWGAQAGLYINYGVEKVLYSQKVFGVFEHQTKHLCSLTRGFDDLIMIPHSRYSGVNQEQLEKLIDQKQLNNLVASKQLGPVILSTKNHQETYVIGHMEYDKETLDLEYSRDLKTDVPVELPTNYYFHNNPADGIHVSWKAHANLFFSNWIDSIYQNTPFDLAELNS
jgi:homoserine O-succinyltransferase